jgi:hypothetical protein
VPLDPDWFTVVLAFIAVALSSAGLYFSALEGPDIRVIKSKGAHIFSNPPLNSSLDHIQHDFVPNGSQLTFVNDGTSGGFLRLEATFKMAKDMDSFLDNLTLWVKDDCSKEDHSYVLENGRTIEMDNIPIGEKDSRIVSLLVRLSLHDWKEFREKPVPNGKILEVLIRAQNDNMNRLLDFYSKMKETPSLGTMCINSVHSHRKPFRSLKPWELDEKKEFLQDLEVISITLQLVDSFAEPLFMWTHIQPHEYLDDLKEVMNYFRVIEGEFRNVAESINKAIPEIQVTIGETLSRLDRFFEGNKSRQSIYSFLVSSAEVHDRMIEFVSKARTLEKSLHYYELEQQVGSRLVPGMISTGLLLKQDMLSSTINTLKTEAFELATVAEEFCRIIGECIESISFQSTES